MSDGRVAVLASGHERSQLLKELLEFAHFQPIVLESAPAGPQADAGQWLAAVVGIDRPSLCSTLDGLRRFDSELPVVALGDRRYIRI